MAVLEKVQATEAAKSLINELKKEHG